jgi:hypothetical protein
MLSHLLFYYFRSAHIISTAIATIALLFSLFPLIFGPFMKLNAEQPLSTLTKTIPYRWPLLYSTIPFVFNGPQFFLELL